MHRELNTHARFRGQFQKGTEFEKLYEFAYRHQIFDIA